MSVVEYKDVQPKMGCKTRVFLMPMLCNFLLRTITTKDKTRYDGKAF